MRPGQSKTFARQLRRNATDAERRLWRQLRNRQLAGFRFRRQFQIGPFFADFVCLEARLIVELDGGQHGSRSTDFERDQFLAHAGFHVLRVWNIDVGTNLEGVCETILATLHSPAPSPALPRSAGEGDRARTIDGV